MRFIALELFLELFLIVGTAYMLIMWGILAGTEAILRMKKRRKVWIRVRKGRYVACTFRNLIPQEKRRSRPSITVQSVMDK